MAHCVTSDEKKGAFLDCAINAMLELQVCSQPFV